MRVVLRQSWSGGRKVRKTARRPTDWPERANHDNTAALFHIEMDKLEAVHVTRFLADLRFPQAML
jgi:hypothetical protein